MSEIQKILVIAFCLTVLSSCGNQTKKEAIQETSLDTKNITTKVDEAVQVLDGKISNYKKIAQLDHHRMAAETGVYTPPSIVSIFSDPKIDIALINENQLTALDLPFKILCYSEPDTTEVKVAYTSAAFIMRRHQMNASQMQEYENNINKTLSVFPKEMISNTDLSNVSKDFGIISIKSDFDYQTTISQLKEAVMSQNDTKWFADIDFQKEALDMNTTLRPTILLLFGGPAPGGKAMVTSPKIGLDAFCQKLLVYEKANGEVWVSFNDIVAFAELYYNQSTKPQQMINQRLKMTFTKAISKMPEE